jgi:hypothetical protein
MCSSSGEVFSDLHSAITLGLSEGLWDRLLPSLCLAAITDEELCSLRLMGAIK